VVLGEDPGRRGQVELRQEHELNVSDGGLDRADPLGDLGQCGLRVTLHRRDLEGGDREGAQLAQPLMTALNACVTSRPCSPSSTGSNVQFLV
jgi:hypothetical protein